MRTWRLLASAGALLALLIASPAAAQLQKIPGDAQPDQFRTPVTTDMTWRDMGCALGGTFTPHLAGTGTLEGGELVTLTMSNVICDSPAFLVVGFDSIFAVRARKKEFGPPGKSCMLSPSRMNRTRTKCLPLD